MSKTNNSKAETGKEINFPRNLRFSFLL